MIIVQKGKELGDALTMSPGYMGTHENGWTIQGKIQPDFPDAVNQFVAVKDPGGEDELEFVVGDFESWIAASSQRAYEEFIDLFPPESWSYSE